MKKFQHIFSNLCDNNFRRVNTIRIIEQLLIALPYNLRKSFRYFSVKGDTIFIAFNHPSSVSEFNHYKRDIMLNALESAKANPALDTAQIAHITKIRAFLPKDALKARDSTPREIIVECYKERAKGDFEIPESHPFGEFFKRIQSAIKSHNESR